MRLLLASLFLLYGCTINFQIEVSAAAQEKSDGAIDEKLRERSKAEADPRLNVPNLAVPGLPSLPEVPSLPKLPEAPKLP